MELNSTSKSVEEKTRTINHEDGEAFEPFSNEMSLYKVTINNLLENKYYEDDEESFNNVKKAFDNVASDNPEFALKLADYARNEMGLRDISQVLLVLSALDSRTQEYVSEYGANIMSRADEPLKVLNFYIQEKGNKSINENLQKAIEDALHQYDEYQFAKYDRDSREMSYVDLFNLVHPNPRDNEHDEIFESIVYGELDDYTDVEPLETPHTWETTISEKGNNTEAWRSVLDDMGLFATIRNARNMLEAGLSGEEIFGEFDDNDREWIKGAKLFPFRFYQSYKAITEACVDDRTSREWLQRAMEVSTDNLPESLSSTAVGVDVSGSMNTLLSERSNMSYAEISSFFGSLLYKLDARVFSFATKVREVRDVRPEDTPMTIMDEIINANVSNGTNGYLIPKALRENEVNVDRMVILTDMQMYNTNGYGTSTTFKEEFEKYKEEYPDTSLYMIDVSSYGSLKTPETMNDVYRISGWNDNIIDFIEYAENENEIIDEIEEY